MRKLAQSYALSASQLDGLEKPAFPPPPGAIVPEQVDGLDAGNGYIDRQADTDGSSGGSRSESGPSERRVDAAITGRSDVTSSSTNVVSRPVSMEIAGTSPLSPAHSAPSVSAPTTPGPTKADGGYQMAPILPTGVGRRSTTSAPHTGGKPTGMSRPSMTSSSGSFGAQTGRPTSDSGIVGGRPVAQAPGRTNGGLARGTVIGEEGTQGGRGAMGQVGQGAGMSGARGGSQGGIGGRRVAGETGGLVGGRPQQAGRAAARSFTPGGTGLVRGGPTSIGASGAGQQLGRGAAATPQRAADPRRDDRERPDYLVEDEETWQQGARRVVPPVVG
ncbi:hypothetical protein JOC24_006233 [Streptomyces sp. HB132]|nr:hypothetical protein [Streptomyces sp. HB132]